ncbi:class I SAM-dependent methyltransferase [Spirulina sp. CS-785/01]|uniref:class I SAM-dependent methyltransferase n=1 Tax=Spirulina sp. CS-785/01 TaxID=3021716 RepID=UPI002330DBAF|nr:class I SAM-dependent methyltransferase [Spirulina sp. CS-785/01]MDB9313375.1 class I SAM-dependent methyltransferase [Spirulina sp. CS-785/01]
MSGLANLQKRFFAWGMSRANDADSDGVKLKDCDDHESLGELKAALLNSVQGRVVEIGPGAGASFAYLPKDIQWIGIEPNPYMHRYLQEEARKQGIESVEVYEGMAEKLPLIDESVDTVVGIHVLCSVGDVQEALGEIRRVLKPGGVFVFLEHIADQRGSWNRRLQDAIAPVWKGLFDNCHPHRETDQVLQAQGFERVDEEYFRLSFPNYSPHVAGVARKS